MKAELSAELGREADIYIDNRDKQAVIFAYPNLFANMSTLSVICLEIGALAAWTPARLVSISPYTAKQYPRIFKQRSTDVLIVAPERTFWEKATILHHEANRPEHLEMPHRYSRHYDLCCMSKSAVKASAFKQLDLLQQVVNFKNKFYPRGWAHYSDAKPGTLKLVPPDYRLAALKTDYISMRDMLFGDVPSFQSVMNTLRLLEEEINGL